MESVVLRFRQEAVASEKISIGAGANGDVIGATKHHLLRNGKPWYPLMGEFHYSRYPRAEWETELYKMKAAGIQVVATYIFWIHHEEEKGVWRTDGNLDLRWFILLCRKVGLEVFLRIGPWAHGECRNGGFPDWLQNDQTIRARTDDPAYLDPVRGLYAHIYEAARGLLLKDGGPVIGVQLENEYGHCGGESGGKGLEHMRTLKRLAQEAGFLVPLYTATGWGGANVVDGEMLPVMGGYADAPWDRCLEALPANANFLLLPALNDPLIASDWQHEGESFTFQADAYPYLTAELGGGLQCTFHRRPLVSAVDTAAQALAKLGSGANMLGYYMFHGGTHPVGRCGTLQESTATGSWTDVPRRSYDFQAPIGEFGGLHASFYALKALHMAVTDAGEALAGSICYYPEDQVKDAENVDDLRYSVRWNRETDEGFLFVNHHQRLRVMNDHRAVRFTIAPDGREFVLPEMDIPDGFYGIIPVNLRAGKRRLLTTNAQFLCRLGDMPVLFAAQGQKAEARFDEGAPACVILSYEEAMRAWRIGDKLYLAEGCLLAQEGGITAIAEQPKLRIRRLPDEATLTIAAEEVSVSATFAEEKRTEDCTVYRVSIAAVPAEKTEDVLLNIDFTGDHAEVYLEGELIVDWYTTGQPWRMALKRFGYPRELEVRVFPVKKPTYFEIPVPEGASLNHVSAAPVYRMRFRDEDFS